MIGLKWTDMQAEEPPKEEKGKKGDKDGKAKGKAKK